MRCLIVLTVLATAAIVAAEDRTITLIDGRTVVYRSAIPCEVQANRPAAGLREDRCRTCGDRCDCAGTCVCDREEAARAARVDRPGRSAVGETTDERLARLRAAGGWMTYPNGHRVWTTLGDWIDSGGSLENLNRGSLSADDLAWLRWPYSGVGATVVHPVAQPIPVQVQAPAPVVYYTTRPGLYYSGPFGGSAAVCLPGGG